MAELEEVEPPVPLVLLPCTSCNRTFRPEALAKHSKVCEKSLMKKRKKFDSAKQRLQGTDVPVFPPPPKSKESPLKPLQQTKWREKQVEITKSLNSGRKKSEQTSSFPVKPSDHERCPYCDRHFGPKAYDRHTEWCKEQHIKLKNNNNVNIEARERLQVRTKYRAPLSNRVLTRDKYQPRSRDPSPMSASRIEADDPMKQKLPSPLNRTSSLRLSSRSKSMITKSPSVPPIELKEGIMRKNQSSITVRQQDVTLNDVEKHLASHDRGVTQPKILSGNQNQKKVTDFSSNNWKKRRSWTSPANLGGICSPQMEEVQVYSCLVEPMKRTNDGSLSDTDDKKIISTSKSFDVLPCTYTVNKRRSVEKVRTLPILFKAVEEVFDVTYEVEGDETSEMISDEILRRTDSWRLLPVVLLNKPDVYHIETTDNRFSNILAVEFKEDDVPERLSEENEESEESVLSETSDTDSYFLFPWEKTSNNSFNNFELRDREMEDCPMELNSDSNSHHNHDLNSYESLLADFQEFIESNSKSESTNDTMPNNFVKMYKITEINDVGTSIDGLQQYADNSCVSSLVSKCSTQDVKPKLHSRSTSVLVSSNTSSLKHEREGLQLSDNHFPSVDSSGNLETSTPQPNSLKAFNESQINISNSDGESLASYPFPFFDILQKNTKPSVELPIGLHCEEASSSNCDQKPIDLRSSKSSGKIVCVDKATSANSSLAAQVASIEKKSLVDHKHLLQFRELSSRSELVQVELPCPDCAATKERLHSLKRKTSNEENLRRMKRERVKCKQFCKSKRYFENVDKSDDNSTWSLSTTSLSSWCSPADGKKRAKCYLKKKTVKYYETIEYKTKKNEATSTKSSVGELPSAKNPQKMVTVKTMVKPLRREQGDINVERKPDLSRSCEYLKLPPIKQRFARPRLVT